MDRNKLSKCVLVASLVIAVALSGCAAGPQGGPQGRFPSSMNHGVEGAIGGCVAGGAGGAIVYGADRLLAGILGCLVGGTIGGVYGSQQPKWDNWQERTMANQQKAVGLFVFCQQASNNRNAAAQQLWAANGRQASWENYLRHPSVPPMPQECSWWNQQQSAERAEKFLEVVEGPVQSIEFTAFLGSAEHKAFLVMHGLDTVKVRVAVQK